VTTALANAAQAAPERSDARRTQQRCARCLVKDLKAFINYLYVLARADFAVRVGRCAVACNTRKGDTVKVKKGAGHIGRKQTQKEAISLSGCVRRVLMLECGRYLRIFVGFALDLLAYFIWLHFAERR